MSAISMVQLEELMATRLGSVDPSKFAGETFELYSIPAFDSRKPEILAAEKIGSTKQIVQPGDVLLSKIVPHIRRSWVVGPAGKYRQIASGEWIVFRSNDAAPQYLRHVLLSDDFHAQFRQTVSGVGGSLLRARPAQVGKIGIPFPSLAEQRRIAAILDQADALRAKRREALEKLEQLGQAIFIEMFGDPVVNPKGWPEDVYLGAVAEIISGITKGRKVQAPTREVPYLAVSNVQDMRLSLSVVKTIGATEDEISRYVLRENDLMLTEGGDPDKLGRGALWNMELGECIHQNHVFRVRLISKEVNPIFLNWLVGSRRGKNYFLKSAKQTTGIASINMGQLKRFPLLVPPINLQNKFASVIEKLAMKVKLHKDSAAMLDDLMKSLQHSAFAAKV